MLKHNGRRLSRIAADEIVKHAPTQRRKVLQALMTAGSHGLTRQELEEATGLGGDSIRPRVCELVEMHIIRELPENHARRTRSGRDAAILTAY